MYHSHHTITLSPSHHCRITSYQIAIQPLPSHQCQTSCMYEYDQILTSFSTFTSNRHPSIHCLIPPLLFHQLIHQPTPNIYKIIYEYDYNCNAILVASTNATAITRYDHTFQRAGPRKAFFQRAGPRKACQDLKTCLPQSTSQPPPPGTIKGLQNVKAGAYKAKFLAIY